MPQSSSSKSSIDYKKLAIWAALLILVGGGFYLSDQRTGKVEGSLTERSVDVNAFLKLQCERDEFRDRVIIGALQDAKRRAQRSIGDPFEKAFEVGRIQASIDQIQATTGQCIRTLPPVNS